jgi:hypothetical protein
MVKQPQAPQKAATSKALNTDCRGSGTAKQHGYYNGNGRAFGTALRERAWLLAKLCFNGELLQFPSFCPCRIRAVFAV